MHKLVYGIDEFDNVVLGSNTYDYNSSELIQGLMVENKKVRLTNDIDRPLDFLPNGIEELRIGGAFDYPIDNLPITLKYLEISKWGDMGYCSFNQPLDCLPINLEELRLCYCFNGYYNQPLYNLPPNLKVLFIHNLKFYTTSTEIMNLPTLSNLPNSLEVLQLNNYDFDFNLQVLPSKLKTFDLGIRIHDLQTNRKFIQTFMNSKYPHVKFTFSR